MSTSSSGQKGLKKERSTPEFVESIVDTFKQNGGLFTICAVVLICVSGISIVEDPQNWWVSAVAVLVFSVIVFLFMNAIVFLKVILASFITMVFSSFGFSIGSSLDPRGTGGIVWMCVSLSLFFVCLAFSYLVSSGKSRWGGILLSQTIAFCSIYIISMGLIDVNIGVISGFIIGFSVFAIHYKLRKASRYSKKAMPENRLTEDLIEAIEAGATEAMMNSVAILGKKENTGNVLVWADRAYLLHPVFLQSAFTAIGRRNSSLGYQKKNINPWLINISFSETPAWKTRNADVMLVLVDLENRNGSEPKVIDVSLPDTKKTLPVGIIPGRVLKSNNKDSLRKAFEQLEDEFNLYVKPLNDKQLRAISRIGKIQDDSTEE